MTEQEQFLKDLEGNQTDTNLEKPLLETEPEKEESTEDSEARAKNRRERRLMQQNQQLREEAIAATARAQALSEVNKFQKEVGDDHLKEVEAIFGTDTPEKKAATDILKKALNGMSEAAVQKALEKLDERQTNESTEVREAEDEIESGLEDAEDETGLDLSEGGADRQGYLTLVERLSKKDREGNIIEYPDFVTAAQLYERTKERPTSSRARDLASRSMTRSGQSQPSKIEQDATLRFLRENGIDV